MARDHASKQMPLDWIHFPRFSSPTPPFFFFFFKENRAWKFDLITFALWCIILCRLGHRDSIYPLYPNFYFERLQYEGGIETEFKKALTRKREDSHIRLSRDHRIIRACLRLWLKNKDFKPKNIFLGKALVLRFCQSAFWPFLVLLDP